MEGGSVIMARESVRGKMLTEINDGYYCIVRMIVVIII